MPVARILLRGLLRRTRGRQQTAVEERPASCALRVGTNHVVDRVEQLARFLLSEDRRSSLLVGLRSGGKHG